VHSLAQVYYTDSDSEGKAPTIIETSLPVTNRASAAPDDEDRILDKQEDEDQDESEEEEDDESEEEEQNENEEEDISEEEDVVEEVEDKDEERVEDRDEELVSDKEEEDVKHEDEHAPLEMPSVESLQIWVDDTPCDEDGEPLAEEVRGVLFPC